MGGLLVLLVVLGSLFMVGLRLAPHYYEYYLVKSAMERVREQPPTEVNPRSLNDYLDNQIYIDNVRGVKIDAIKIRPLPEGYEVNLGYEVREHLFANVDAVLTFAHKVVVPRRW